MNQYLPTLLLAIFLTFSARTCTAWAPMQQSLPNSYARLLSTRLAFQQRNARSEGNKVDAKHAIAFPWINGKDKVDAKQQQQRTSKPAPKKIKLLKKEMEDDGLLSPKLLSAGAVVGLIALLASFSTANSFDMR